MRIVFAGTPAFARVALEALHAAGFEIVGVLTQPDRPAGRGLRLHPSPVKTLAQAHGWPVLQPRSLRLDGSFPGDAASARQALTDAAADAMVVAAYGLMRPGGVRVGPLCGWLTTHASRLPRWRGAAPIHRAIEAGDTQTGVTIMQMDAGLDTGDMLLAQALPIGEDDNTARLHDRLAALGARLIVQALRQAGAGTLEPVPQPAEGATYAHKIGKHEARIDWAQPAARIVARIRAFDPAPGAHSELRGETIKLWVARAEIAAPGQEPGTILATTHTGIAVAAINSIATITELQRAGGKRLPAAEFLRGFEVKPGQAFG